MDLSFPSQKSNSLNSLDRLLYALSACLLLVCLGTGNTVYGEVTDDNPFAPPTSEVDEGDREIRSTVWLLERHPKMRDFVHRTQIISMTAGPGLAFACSVLLSNENTHWGRHVLAAVLPYALSVATMLLESRVVKPLMERYGYPRLLERLNAKLADLSVRGLTLSPGMLERVQAIDVLHKSDCASSYGALE